MALTSRSTQYHEGSDEQSTRRTASTNRAKTGSGTQRGTQTRSGQQAGSANKTAAQQRNTKQTTGLRKTVVSRAATESTSTVTTLGNESRTITQEDVGVSFSLSIPIKLGTQPKRLTLSLPTA